MSKLTKKDLIRQLLELEDNDLGDVGNQQEHKEETPIEKNETINDAKNEESITRPKKKLTEKQLEALKKGQEKRNENRLKNRLEKEKKEEEERKLLEEKLVKKAIALKKKQLKKQALLDEISDDDTPIQKIKEITKATVDKALEPEKPKGPIIRFV